MTETGSKISKTRKILIIVNVFLVAGLAVGLVFKYRPVTDRRKIHTVGITQSTATTTAASTTTTERVLPVLHNFC